MVVTHLSKMLLENHAGHGARGPREPILCELSRGVQFGVEEICLDQLSNVEQRAFKARFH